MQNILMEITHVNKILLFKIHHFCEIKEPA